MQILHKFSQLFLGLMDCYRKLKLNRQRLNKGLFLLSLVICLLWGQLVAAENSQVNLLVEQGIKAYHAGNFIKAIASWKQAIEQDKNNPAATAVIQENLGRAYQQIGENPAAIASFTAAIQDYGRVENIQQVGRMKSELAQVYNNLGQPRKAIALLCGNLVDKLPSYEKPKNQEISCIPESASQIASKYNDKIAQVAALGILGEAYRLTGNYEQAIKYLQAGQKIAPEDFLLLNSLGNVYNSRAQLRDLQADSAKKAGIVSKEKELAQQSISDYHQAKLYFQASVNSARDRQQVIGELRGLLNLIQLGSQSNQNKVLQDDEFNQNVTAALQVLATVPNSSSKVYGGIELAYLQRDSQGTALFTTCPQRFLADEIVVDLLKKSVLASENLQDNRLISYANGALGHYWECQANNAKTPDKTKLNTALKYTQAAIIAADNKLNAKDSLYLWEWQAGRIFDKLDNPEAAIAAYQRAFDILEDIREDLLTAERDVQFDFRDVVRPLYQKLAQSRLELLGVGAIADEKRANELSAVVKTVDALKLAELQNYFGNDCILSGLNPQQVGELLQENSATFKNTAFLSSIILEDKTGILLQLPDRPTKFNWIKDPNQPGTDKIVSSATLQQKIAEFRQGLLRKEDINYDPTIAAQLYDWIIRPFAADLELNKVTTLVFIQDGFLRSVPMAALYNRENQKYLVQTYAVATTPSLRLTTPKLRDRSLQKALILGVTETATIEGKTFAKLTAVNDEISTIQNIFPQSQPLVNENFVPEKFQQTLKKSTYPIVHIASHAQFGIIPEDTFIVTGNNKKLTISQLETALRNLNSKPDRVELLALTACQTAVGDDRATLGLAGVALQVGVKSAIASLWNVNDQSTSELVKAFYTNYRNAGMTIAQALQTAQIRMIDAKTQGLNPLYEHPAYWAAMIAIGNWL
ncbi:TPR repeat protein [Calothrix brevissima NIES-22]|nr:TPR repeat protein [Calothrix brevissima NIES-22]